jgi:outer membrane lipoprotein SlyB
MSEEYESYYDWFGRQETKMGVDPSGYPTKLSSLTSPRFKASMDQTAHNQIRKKTKAEELAAERAAEQTEAAEATKKTTIYRTQFIDKYGNKQTVVGAGIGSVTGALITYSVSSLTPLLGPAFTSYTVGAFTYVTAQQYGIKDQQTLNILAGLGGSAAFIVDVVIGPGVTSVVGGVAGAVAGAHAGSEIHEKLKKEGSRVTRSKGHRVRVKSKHRM